MSAPLSRRQLLKGAATACLVTASRVATPAAAQDSRPPRIDTHLHCFAGASDTRFPYHERGPYKPEAPATPEQLLACMPEAGVDYAVVVHPEPYQDDHRYLEHCLAVGKEKLKGTLLLFADRPGSLEKMPELCRQLNPLAVRVHAHAADRLPPFGKPELKRLWSMATDHGLAVQLHFQPRYAPGFEPLIREFSKTTVIIDHMGRPFQGTPAEHAVVLGWAKLSNTVMKLSSLPPLAEKPDREIEPVVKQLTNLWGAERMIYGDSFGSDTTGATYRQAFERARGLLSHLSSADQAKILGGTAAKLFHFGA